jgi:hypothetical protein
MRRGRAIFLSFSLILVVIVFYSRIRLGVLTGFFLWDLLDEKNLQHPERGALAWIACAPSTERLQISQGERNIPADLYFPKDGSRRAAILLTHGIIEDGKDDPRLVRSQNLWPGPASPCLSRSLKG